MSGPLEDQTVLVVGRGSGIARAVVEAARAAGADVIAAARDAEKLGTAYDDPDITVETVDITDDESIQLAVAITNGAADTLTRSLAVELAPIRVNAISPGIIDTGAWDGLGEEGKARLYREASDTNPARRIGESEDVADAVVFCMTNTFLTGMTLKVDGGEYLV